MRKLDSFCDGFLPNGLFARLLAKLVDWSQNTGGGNNKYSEGHAQINFCGQVMMECHLDVVRIEGADGGLGAECIRVKLSKLNAGQMIDRIAERLRRIKAECMERLQFHVAVDMTADVKTCSRAEEGATYVIGLKALRSCDRPLCIECKDARLRKADLASHSKQVWDVAPCDQYPDVFLSYRHATDSTFAQQLYERLCYGKLPGEGEAEGDTGFFSVDDDGRRMRVFLSSQPDALRTGERFESQLVDTIDSSLVVVPIVSASALDRMIEQPVDYLLLEWQAAMIIAESKSVKDAKLVLLPIVVPDMHADEEEKREGTAAGLALTDLEDHAPDKVPKGTVECLFECLGRVYQDASLPSDAEGWHRTARQTVHTLLNTVHRPEVLHGGAAVVLREWDRVEHAAQTIFKMVDDRIREEPWHQQRSAAGVLDAVQAHSKPLALSAQRRTEAQERQILADALDAANKRVPAVSADELQSFNDLYGASEFKPPSMHPALEKVLAAFKLLRDNLGERASSSPGEAPKMSAHERAVFQRCEDFTQKFLLAYVRLCTDTGNAELRELMRADSVMKKRQYAGTYQAQVDDSIKKEACYQGAVSTASDLSKLACAGEMPTATRDLATFMCEAAIAHERVTNMIQAFTKDKDGREPLKAKLKVAYRVIEKALKSMSGPLEKLEEQWAYEKANDCARGAIECSGMKQCIECLQWFSSLHKEGQMVLLKVKDRFSGPTDGGWSDFLVMFLFPGGVGGRVPCEIQIVHKALMTARTGMGAHDAYDGFRAACETLALTERLAKFACEKEAGEEDEDEQKDAQHPVGQQAPAALPAVPPRYCLVVECLRAVGIKDVQTFGTQDPYIEAHIVVAGTADGCEPQRCKEAKYGGTTPEWTAEHGNKLKFSHEQLPATAAIQFNIMNSNLVIDDPIGRTECMMVDAIPNTMESRECKLIDGPGCLYVRMQRCPITAAVDAPPLAHPVHSRPPTAPDVPAPLSVSPAYQPSELTVHPHTHEADNSGRWCDPASYELLKKLGDESRNHEFKSLFKVSDRCPAVIFHKMVGYAVKFISACLNADVDGTIYFGIADGKDDVEDAKAREVFGLPDEYKLPHGTVLGVRMPRKRKQKPHEMGEEYVRQEVLGVHIRAAFAHDRDVQEDVSKRVEPVFYPVRRADGSAVEDAESQRIVVCFKVHHGRRATDHIPRPVNFLCTVLQEERVHSPPIKQLVQHALLRVCQDVQEELGSSEIACVDLITRIRAELPKTILPPGETVASWLLKDKKTGKDLCVFGDQCSLDAADTLAAVTKLLQNRADEVTSAAKKAHKGDEAKAAFAMRPVVEALGKYVVARPPSEWVRGDSFRWGTPCASYVRTHHGSASLGETGGGGAKAKGGKKQKQQKQQKPANTEMTSHALALRNGELAFRIREQSLREREAAAAAAAALARH
jgi:hypothetical protein